MTFSHLFQAMFLSFAAGLCVFCFVLARRLRRLNDLETGLGGAIAVMSSEISRLEAAIIAAKAEAMQATQALADEIERAKQERAFWVLQKKFAESSKAGPTRLRRRRRQTEEAMLDG
ncbi:hypothetical protein RGQ15_05030 [Paracoccus sp. MBLB3053]|uniref:Uncharacterized protein n=1 Tax=Paracoccus aurantius TaxID=3073814 RepID=A0ABU2HPH1_9RHOB|nr:hypothetical protein [Paracoccus sp. MBLB3053]MDS9466941.1 hypothetical protein [Paracoccus sp. MBLB3053]